MRESVYTQATLAGLTDERADYYRNVFDQNFITEQRAGKGTYPAQEAAHALAVEAIKKEAPPALEETASAGSAAKSLWLSESLEPLTLETREIMPEFWPSGLPAEWTPEQAYDSTYDASRNRGDSQEQATQFAQREKARVEHRLAQEQAAERRIMASTNYKDAYQQFNVKA